MTRSVKHGHGSNGKESPEYRSWVHMRERCNNPRHHAYSAYGGKGISVCEEWESFITFLSDMGPRPSRLHTLDRIDNTQGYSKDNCRWATKKEQAVNRKSSRSIEYMGQTYPTIMAFAKAHGLGYSLVVNRINKGWPVEHLAAPKGAFGTRADLKFI